ncbi:MAG: 5-formyltetrahydrofolate cyclo-ligase [Phycisphaerae bacterium]|nr:5-formyltetrahydrofolate cyclo-ligase [Phycisphaerae bacterium]
MTESECGGTPGQTQGSENARKSEIRKALRATLAAMSDADRHDKSLAACNVVAATPEFQSAGVIMLYLAVPTEVDVAPLALRAWQHNKTVVVPKVSWDQRRMLAVEITSLNTGLSTTHNGVREPIAGSPIPANMIDFVVVPGLGFTANGHRIGRGMGFYDRFLAQGDFTGASCGIAFEEQLVSSLDRKSVV